MKNTPDGEIAEALQGLRTRLDTLASINAEHMLVPGGPQERSHQMVEQAYTARGGQAMLAGHVCDDVCQHSYPNDIQTHPHDEVPGENRWASEQMRASSLLGLERPPAPPHMEFA